MLVWLSFCLVIFEQKWEINALNCIVLDSLEFYNILSTSWKLE